MSHVTNTGVRDPVPKKWVMSRKWMNHFHSCERVISRLRMRHFTRMNESYHIYEWVMSETQLCVFCRLKNEPCHEYEWVMLHKWMSRVTRTNESCHAYKWVMSRVWMNHVTQMNESCHAYEWVMSRTQVCVFRCLKSQGEVWEMDLQDFYDVMFQVTSHGTYMNESWHIHEWVMAHTWICRIFMMSCFR